jgi:hypothetical protein
MDAKNINELREHGVELAQSNENYLRVLRGMGVPDGRIVVLEDYAVDTLDELGKVRDLCLKRSWKSLLVVTSNDHTRRTRLTTRYVFEPDVHTTVIGSKYGGIHRQDWWKNTGDVRTFLIEFQKLVAYTLYIWPKTLWKNPGGTKLSRISSAFPGSSSTWDFSPSC